MTYNKIKSLCRFCKYYHLDTQELDTITCEAFPMGIPQSIFLIEEFDHREPYPSDNGIQFELLTDTQELRKRFPEFLQERLEEAVEYSLNKTYDWLDMGRRNGYTDPPLQSDD